MSQQTKVLVTGAGGFIGHHLSKYLVDRGYYVRGVDIKEPEYEASAANEFLLLDLSKADNCLAATEGMDHVYGLAANRSEEHTSELQSRLHLVCRLLLE